MDSKLTWQKDMTFLAVNREITSHLDATREFGGGNSAPTPKEALLNALSACSAMDVMSILSKMRLVLDKFSIDSVAEQTKSIPSYFSSVKMSFRVEGEIPPEKLVSAVVLSMTKLCGVGYMVSQVCPIHFEVYLNSKLIHSDDAKFAVETTHG